jgi:hypothetical protein
MQSTNIPSKIPLPFAYAASSGYINTIPAASQIGITNGRASLHDGFPPDTFTPISSGGVPPFGGDFNGILNEITAIQQWQEAGGFFPFDPTFATTVGGYPKGAIIQSSTGVGFWISTVENNSNNPDSGGAGWVPTGFYGLISVPISGTSFTVTNLEAAYPIISFTGSISGTCVVTMPNFQSDWIVINNTTGGFPLQIKTASGTGITLNNNQSTTIYGDGVNIYFSSTAAVSSFNSRVGAVTLSSSDVTEALGFSPVNSALFVQSLATNGYQKLPGGLILQWGTGVMNGGETLYGPYYFPISFPNGCLNLSLTTTTGEGTGGAPDRGSDCVSEIPTGNPPTNSYFYVWNNYFGAGDNYAYGFQYFAIGY